MPDSSTAGYLIPSSSSPYDDGLDDILHNVIVGITGLTGDLVRPRWQPEPPQQPGFDVNWCAFGIVRTSEDVFASSVEASNGGSVEVSLDEQLFVLHSFYGPSATAICKHFAKGLMIDQNRDAIKAANVNLVEVQEATILPALLKEKWVKRVDVTVVYRRRVGSTYPVLTFLSAGGLITTDQHVNRTVDVPHS